MSLKTRFDKIALGDATPADARSTLRDALADGSDEVLHQAYTCLRSWVWKALDGRRRDSELYEWFDVLKANQARLAHAGRPEAERMRVLQELIDESIGVAERLPADRIASRQHVREVLVLLRDAVPAGEMARSAIGVRLGVKQANLTRILNLMAATGLIERHPSGKQAIFRLTRAGQAAAAGLPRSAARAPRPKARQEEMEMAARIFGPVVRVSEEQKAHFRRLAERVREAIMEIPDKQPRSGAAKSLEIKPVVFEFKVNTDRAAMPALAAIAFNDLMAPTRPVTPTYDGFIAPTPTRKASNA